MPKVLIVTFSWTTVVEMPYLLKKAKCTVHVLCPQGNWAIKNSFYDHWIDSGDSIDTLIQKLAELDSQAGYDHIMIGDDPVLWKIYRENITALWHLLPIHNKTALHILNKIGFAQHCQLNKIPSPKFQIVDSTITAKIALEALGLPIVLKKNYSYASAGVKIIKDTGSYQRYINEQDFTEPLLAQQFIKGSQVGVEALFKEGRLLEYVCSYDLDESLGPSTKRRYFPNDEKIGCLVRKLGETALLHGFANISLIEDEERRNFYMFEADPRPNKWVPYARWFGRDFSVAFKRFLASDETNLATSAPTDQKIDQWEIEHFNSRMAKLINEKRPLEAVLHLLDFDRNLKYTIYDPVLLKAKMDDLYRQLKPSENSEITNSAHHGDATQSSSFNEISTHRPQPNVTSNTLYDSRLDVGELTDEVHAQIASLQFANTEISRLQERLAAMQTARNSYVQALLELVNNQP